MKLIIVTTSENEAADLLSALLESWLAVEHHSLRSLDVLVERGASD